MKKIIVFIYVCRLSMPLVGQLHVVIPFEEVTDFSSPLAVGLYLNDGSYVVPMIYITPDLATVSATAVVPEGEVSPDVRLSVESPFAYSSIPLGFASTGTYALGKDRSQATGIQVCRMRDDYKCSQTVTLPVDDELAWPYAAGILGDNFLVCYYAGEGTADGNVRLALLDSSLQVQWHLSYRDDVSLLYPHELTTRKVGDDLGFMLSTSYKKFGQFGVRPGLTNFDAEGNVIWEYEGAERLYAGTTRVDHVVLSDGRIVVSYEIDKQFDLDFFGNDWYPYPTKLVWLSAEGDSLSEQLQIYKLKKRVRMRNLHPGLGDYFFGFGTREDANDVYRGEITKFTNDGDTIWSRLYEHVELASGDIAFEVHDIIEKEDGTIGVVCSASHATQQAKIWLFELNEHGCFGDYTDCDELLSVATEEVAIPDQQRPIIVPNPTSRYVQVSMPYDQSLVSIALHTVHGERLPVTMSDTGQVDLGSAPQGVYLLTLRSAAGVYTERVVRW